MNKQQIEAVTTLIVTVLSILNMVLQAKGLPAIQIGSETISLTINGIVVIVTTVIAWWRNNNITPEAQEAQVVLNQLKKHE